MSATREEVACAENAIRKIRAVLKSNSEDASRAVHKWSWSSSIVPNETIADPRLGAEVEAVAQLLVASLTMKDGGGDRRSMDDSASDDDDMVDPIVPAPSGNCRKRPFSFGIFPAAEDRAAKVQDSVPPPVSETERRSAVTPATNPLSKFAGSKFGLPGIQDRAACFPRNNTSRPEARPPPELFDNRQSRSRFAAPVANRATAEDATPVLRSAREQLTLNQLKNRGGQSSNSDCSSGFSDASSSSACASTNKRLGAFAAFRSPLANAASGETAATTPQAAATPQVDERLKNIEPKMVELIRSEIMDTGPRLSWDDIAGLEFVKATVKEIVVFPMLRPDIFTGLRAPSKGLLLFGPPGTGKTLIGKCIASQSGSTFFSISASSLTSKWVGDGEKMVRALFAVAKVEQPSVVFIDEIDSLLSQRSDTEHESSRRIKTEFLVQLDGATTTGEERILVVGATNRPQDLDEAARRRLVKRLYVPLPEKGARRQIIQNLMLKENYVLSEEDVEAIVEATEGYSGADMTNLCRDAAMGPIRTLQIDITQVTLEDVRPINMSDFSNALRQVKATVSEQDLVQYSEWNHRFGYSK